VASYATAFRAPNIIERLFNGITPEGLGFQILNPFLESENSDNIDVGIKVLTANAFFEAIYFDNEIDNAIIQHTMTDEEIAALPPEVQEEIDQAAVDFVVQQRNADVFKVDGIEIAGAYRFRNGLSLGGNFTSLDGEAEIGGPATDPTGDTFEEKWTGFLRYDQPRGRYWAEYRVRHNAESDQELDPGALVPPVGPVLPSFTIHNLAGGVVLFDSDRFEHNLGVVIANASDELYAEFSNASFFRPQSERNIVGTYRLRFK
jgi:outer membrane receptor protein involved in Fe transport